MGPGLRVLQPMYKLQLHILAHGELGSQGAGPQPAWGAGENRKYQPVACMRSAWVFETSISSLIKGHTVLHRKASFLLCVSVKEIESLCLVPVNIWNLAHGQWGTIKDVLVGAWQGQIYVEKPPSRSLGNRAGGGRQGRLGGTIRGCWSWLPGRNRASRGSLWQGCLFLKEAEAGRPKGCFQLGFPFLLGES